MSLDLFLKVVIDSHASCLPNFVETRLRGAFLRLLLLTLLSRLDLMPARERGPGAPVTRVLQPLSAGSAAPTMRVRALSRARANSQREARQNGCISAPYMLLRGVSLALIVFLCVRASECQASLHRINAVYRCKLATPGERANSIISDAICFCIYTILYLRYDPFVTQLRLC